MGLETALFVLKTQSDDFERNKQIIMQKGLVNFQISLIILFGFFDNLLLFQRIHYSCLNFQITVLNKDKD